MHFDNDHMPEDNHNAGPAQTATLTPPPVSMEIPRPNAFRWRWLRELLEMAFTIIAIYTLVNLLSMRYIVHGRSMDPTFGEGQFLIVSRVHYWFEEPERGDVVVFHAPSNLEEDYIKRVIGIPGDRIEFRDRRLYEIGDPLDDAYLTETELNTHYDRQREILVPIDQFNSRNKHLFVNGFPLEEAYLTETSKLSNRQVEIDGIVPPNTYYVLGDNRNNSVDSRSRRVGFVKRELLIGKVLFRYWPLNELSLIGRNLIPTP